jgi:hypothetical protein
MWQGGAGWLASLDYWRETLLVGFLLGLAAGLFVKLPWLRVLFAGALAILILSSLLFGAICDEDAECPPSGAWGLIASAGWTAALLLTGAVRAAHRLSNRSRHSA